VQVIEEFIAPKTGHEPDCEDGIIVTDTFAAVIDGATDKTGRRFGGLPGGRLAMQVCIEGIRALELGVDGRGIADHLTHLLARRLPRDISREDRPSAMLAIYSPAHRTVWQIGDVRCWYSGLEEKAVNRKSTVDTLATEVRVAVLRAELASGASPADLARDDPGRDAILGVLRHQSVFRNNAGAAQWAYSSIDGAPVPPELIRAHPVPPDVTELVLASDGYPRVQPTLEASEMTLKELLAEDPLCIGRLRGTKGVRPGNQSFDDRAYLRLSV
jgi:hypothetical protein